MIFTYKVVTSVNAPRQPAAVTAKAQPQQLQERLVNYIVSSCHMIGHMTNTCLSCSVHMKVSEKLTLVAGRDGGLQNMEILGMIMLRISDPEVAKIRVALNNNEKRSVQFQVCTHTVVG